MSATGNEMKAASQPWWRPNLFINGDFSQEPVVSRTNLLSSTRAQYLGTVAAPTLSPVVGKYFYCLKYDQTVQPRDNGYREGYVRLDNQQIACKPNTQYTLTWWEMHDVGNVEKIEPDVYVMDRRAGDSNIRLNYRVNKEAKFQKVSLTFTTKADWQKFYLQLGLYYKGLRTNGTQPIYSYYSAIYICEGEDSPEFWIDAESSIIDGSANYQGNLAYYKGIDRLNQLWNEKYKMASATQPGIVKIASNSNMSINSSGELSLKNTSYNSLSSGNILVRIGKAKVFYDGGSGYFLDSGIVVTEDDILYGMHNVRR